MDETSEQIQMQKGEKGKNKNMLNNKSGEGIKNLMLFGKVNISINVIERNLKLLF